MPNWCENRLTVTGPPADMQAFRAAVIAAGTALSLEHIAPTPVELAGGAAPFAGTEAEAARLRATVGAADWYEWRTAKWGTKWDITEAVVDPRPTRLTYRFDSAWSPPTAAIATAAAQYPSLTFILEYDEPGADFWGAVIWAKGDEINSSHGPSKRQYPALWEFAKSTDLIPLHPAGMDAT